MKVEAGTVVVYVKDDQPMEFKITSPFTSTLDMYASLTATGPDGNSYAITFALAAPRKEGA